MQQMLQFKQLLSRKRQEFIATQLFLSRKKECREDSHSGTSSTHLQKS